MQPLRNGWPALPQAYKLSIISVFCRSILFCLGDFQRFQQAFQCAQSKNAHKTSVVETQLLCIKSCALKIISNFLNCLVIAVSRQTGFTAGHKTALISQLFPLWSLTEKDSQYIDRAYIHTYIHTVFLASLLFSTWVTCTAHYCCWSAMAWSIIKG